MSQALSCITRAIWVKVRPQSPADPMDPWTLLVSGAPTGEPIRLKRETGGHVHFQALQRFRSRELEDGSWRMRTMEYNYQLWEQPPDIATKPMLQWHWHPNSGFATTPHLHVRASDEMWGVTTRRLHIASDRVAFESVVRFLIEELKVVALRPDWEPRITTALRAFEEHRSWHSMPPADL